jgi:SAM-dependent methyltransferase
MKFVKTTDSHQHSLETLNLLLEHDDFMFSIRSVIDLGCGTSDDLVWWATRTTRDETPIPLNINCTGIDINPGIIQIKTHPNISYQIKDFEDFIDPYKNGYDILWCHDAFQYATNPLKTLSNWWNLASPGGMLYIGIPITQRIYQRQLDYHLTAGSYYHHTLVSLMYMLATAGWDCRFGFFKQGVQDNWIHAAVYKSDHAPMDPKITTWYQLSELKLLPASAEASIQAHGYLKQQDLIIPWFDHGLTSMAIK